MQPEAVSLVEREGPVQEGVRDDQPAAHIVYSVLCAPTNQTHKASRTKTVELGWMGSRAHTLTRGKWVGGVAECGGMCSKWGVAGVVGVAM